MNAQKLLDLKNWKQTMPRLELNMQPDSSDEEVCDSNLSFKAGKVESTFQDISPVIACYVK